MQEGEPRLDQTIIPERFGGYSYAKKSHWSLLNTFSEELYGLSIDPDHADLKKYQDLLVYAFIRGNVKPGSRLLEVGGGNSRILNKLAAEYECWNIDPFLGGGNGPTVANNPKFRLVKDFMGHFNQDLKERYFDMVFSISALEHTPNERAVHHHIVQDIHRVMVGGGYSLHLLDVVFKKDSAWIKDIVPFLFEHTHSLNGSLAPWREMAADPDLYVMAKEPYDRLWKKHCNNSEYEDFGCPSSVNILWRKGEDE